MIMSAPRPVSTPPTEVASRQPCAVVSNSGTPCRSDERRAGKSRWYQSLIRIRRQSRDNLSASSCPPGYACDGPSPLSPGGDAEDLRRRIMPETPGGKGDRGQQRLRVTRRHVDDQPADLAHAHRRQFCGDDLDMPVHQKGGARTQVTEAALGEADEIAPQQRVVSAQVNLSAAVIIPATTRRPPCLSAEVPPPRIAAAWR